MQNHTENPMAALKLATLHSKTIGVLRFTFKLQVSFTKPILLCIVATVLIFVLSATT